MDCINWIKCSFIAHIFLLSALSQRSLGWPGHISPWSLPGSLGTPQQGADGEGSHLWDGEETLPRWWFSAFGDVYLYHHAAPRAAAWKCSRTGAGSQHWFWTDYEAASVQDYHLLEVLDQMIPCVDFPECHKIWLLSHQATIFGNNSTEIHSLILLFTYCIFCLYKCDTNINHKRETFMCKYVS